MSSIPVERRCPAADASGRLLVIDDEPEVGALIGRVATQVGFETRITQDPTSFFAALATWQPTHLAIDLLMPAMDGVEVVRKLATHRCGASILLMSGADRGILDAAQDAARERGLLISGVVGKPFNLRLLRELLLAPGSVQKKNAPVGCAKWRVKDRHITDGLRRGEFELHYQPRIDLKTLEAVGVEALVRWRHPAWGMLRPETFIPVIETSRHVDAFTEHVFGLATAWASRALGRRLTLSVNLSARNLDDVRLPDRLETHCRRAALDPAEIILEVTETGLAMDRATALDVLTRLRMKGFRLAIDDFGTGYSSIAQLSRLPFSEIKIDRTFVVGLQHRPARLSILQSMIELGRRLRLTTVAEGVEDEATVRLLQELGCDFVQGHYFAPALDEHAASRWLSAGN